MTAPWAYPDVMEAEGSEETSAEASRARRDELRLHVAKSLLAEALHPIGPGGARARIRDVARAHGVSDDWAAEVFWELVRMRFLTSRGGVGPRTRVNK